MNLQDENFELRAELNKQRVENKILRDLLEASVEDLAKAKGLIDDLKPLVFEAVEACKKLMEDADKLKKSVVVD